MLEMLLFIELYAYKNIINKHANNVRRPYRHVNRGQQCYTTLATGRLASVGRTADCCRKIPLPQFLIYVIY